MIILFGPPEISLTGKVVYVCYWVKIDMVEPAASVNWEKKIYNREMAKTDRHRRESIRMWYANRCGGVKHQAEKNTVSPGHVPVPATYDVTIRYSLVIQNRDKIVQPHRGGVFCLLWFSLALAM